MQRHLSNIVWPIAKACGLLAGLTACAPPPAYFAERLDRVPSPTPALMAKTSVPDCTVVASAVAVRPRTTVPAETSPSDFESEAEPRSAAAPKEKAQTELQDQEQDPSSALKRLERERDCYRRAEQIARQRLEALQASSTQTMVALDRIRDEVPGPDEHAGW